MRSSENGESWVRVFLLWADGNGESFISQCYGGEGAGRGPPRKFSPSQDEKQDEHHQQDDEEDYNCTPLPPIWKEREVSVILLQQGRKIRGRFFFAVLLGAQV